MENCARWKLYPKLNKKNQLKSSFLLFFFSFCFSSVGWSSSLSSSLTNSMVAFCVLGWPSLLYCFSFLSCVAVAFKIAWCSGFEYLTLYAKCVMRFFQWFFFRFTSHFYYYIFFCLFGTFLSMNILLLLLLSLSLCLYYWFCFHLLILIFMDILCISPHLSCFHGEKKKQKKKSNLLQSPSIDKDNFRARGQEKRTNFNSRRDC